MQNIIAFIPARGGSKSIPNKNIKSLGGKPLIMYSIEMARMLGLRTIVSTDSEEIKKISVMYGSEVMIRPSKLAQDDTSMYEVLKSEVAKITPRPDYILLLQPTSPFRKKVHLKNAMSYLINSADRFDSVIGCEQVPAKYNPAQMIIGTATGGKGMIIAKLKRTFKQWLLEKLGGAKYTQPSLTGFPIASRLTRRQDFPEAWIPSGEIYFFKTENLDKGSIYGDRVMIYECESTININEEKDWKEAEEYINYKSSYQDQGI